MRYCLLLLVCVAIASVGCSLSSDTGLNESTARFKLPALGSHFVYREWSVDDQGQMTTDHRSYHWSVSAVDTNIQGKSAAIELLEENLPMNYIRLEPDGNLSWIQTGRWVEIPVATRNTLVHEWFDTTAFGTVNEERITYRYLGSDEFDVAGLKFNTVKVSSLYQTWVDHVEANWAGSGGTTIYWFAPETGLPVKDSTLAFHYESGSVANAFGSTLDSCTLK
jgi:hypothetical protein